MGDRRFIWQAGLTSAVVASVVNLVVYALGRAGGADFALVVGGSPTQVGLAGILSMSIGPVLLGTALAALIARGGGHRLRWAQVVGAAIAVLSAAIPLSAAGGETGFLLAAMHLITGASYVLALEAVQRRASDPQPTLAAGVIGR